MGLGGLPARLGSFERFLIREGERVVRVPTKLMAGARRGSRQRGKSDRIDAIAVARAAIAEGIDTLPSAHLDGRELDLRLLVDHRDRLVRARVALNNTLQWHLHDLWPELEIPGGGLFSARWQTRIARRLGHAEQTTRVRIARDELRHLRELTATINDLKREISALIAALAPHLVAQPGFGPLTAAKLVGEIAGVERFATDAKARPRRRRRPDPNQLRPNPPPAPRPRRQPPTQRHPAPHRGHPRPLPPTHKGLHRPQTRRRQVHPRSPPLPQTTPRTPHLPPPPTPHPGPRKLTLLT